MVQGSEPSFENNFTIRTAQQRDLEAIGNLWVELMSFHSRLDRRFTLPTQGRANYIRHTQNALRDGSYQVLVAESQGHILGYIMGYIGQNPPIFPQSRYGFIADLCVAKDCRRNGVGTGLVKTICHWFRAQGLNNIQLNVAHHNPVSQAFWRRVGCTDYLDHMWMEI